MVYFRRHAYSKCVYFRRHAFSSVWQVVALPPPLSTPHILLYSTYFHGSRSAPYSTASQAHRPKDGWRLVFSSFPLSDNVLCLGLPVLGFYLQPATRAILRPPRYAVKRASTSVALRRTIKPRKKGYFSTPTRPCIAGDILCDSYFDSRAVGA